MLGIKQRRRGRKETDCGNNSSTFDKVQKQYGFKSGPIQQPTLLPPAPGAAGKDASGLLLLEYVQVMWSG